VELADIVRAHGEGYAREHPLCVQQARALRAIAACRTAGLGGQAHWCSACGQVTVRYHSCRNRHCPKCQTLTKERWLAARQAELLAVPYFHVVFTLPHGLNALAQGNPRVIYTLLFKAAAETLQTFGRDPKWLGGELGITMVLHTWGQNLGQHLHVHCVVSAGALSPDGTRWIAAKPGFLFPVRALSRMFRGKYLAALAQAQANAELRLDAGATPAFPALLDALWRQDWVVYAKRPFAGPEQVLAYLGRYTHRVALTNERLVSLKHGQVRFRWRDYAHANTLKVMRLDADEFLRRFLLHVLPRGFMRIRHFGLQANRCRARKLAQSRAVLGQAEPEPVEPESVVHFLQRVLRVDITRCPRCGQGPLQRLPDLAPSSQASIPPYSTGPP
jgi:hypothetical protein